MLMTVLTGKKSFKASFKYNYDKVLGGDAEIQYCGNIPGQDPGFPHRLPIQDAFLRHINNPSVSDRTRNEVLHFSFSPGPDDACTREQVVDAIGETLSAAGYGDNPYVVFRHNDIEREHFHLLTPAMDKEGRCIAEKTSRNPMYVMLETLREIGPRYGFTLGESAEAKLRKLQAGADRGPSAGVCDRMRHAFEEAMAFDFDNAFQFRCLLDLRNVMIKKVKNRETGEERLLLQRCNKNREAVSRPVSVNSLFDGRDCLAEYRERMADNIAKKKARPSTDYDYIRRIIGECRKVSRSLPDLRQALSDCGIRTTLSLANDNTTIRRMAVMDMEHRMVCDYSGLGAEYGIAEINGMEKNSRPRRVPMLSPGQIDEILGRAAGGEEQRGVRMGSAQ